MNILNVKYEGNHVLLDWKGFSLSQIQLAKEAHGKEEEIENEIIQNIQGDGDKWI